LYIIDIVPTTTTLVLTTSNQAILDFAAATCTPDSMDPRALEFQYNTLVGGTRSILLTQ